MTSTRAGLLLAACAVLGGPAVAEPGKHCDRACLEGFVDRYLDAVVHHDPARAPLARAVRFTGNGQQLHPGDGLWNTASARGPHKLYVADAETGHVGFFGTIRANGKPAILALRLAIVDGEIREAETLVARSEEGARQVEALGKPHPLYSSAVAPPLPREDSSGPPTSTSSAWSATTARASTPSPTTATASRTASRRPTGRRTRSGRSTSMPWGAGSSSRPASSAS